MLTLTTANILHDKPISITKSFTRFGGKEIISKSKKPKIIEITILYFL